MVEVRTLAAGEWVPQDTSYVLIVELRQRSGAISFIVNGRVIGNPDTLPSGEQFSDFDAALVEAQSFARAHKLSCVHFRPLG